MKNYSTFLFGMVLMIISYSSIAQPGWTVYDHTNTILSSGVYKAIAIDQTGNIWVGGDYSGLYKFDGTTWTKFSTSNSNILHDDIYKIVIDNTNKVWAGNYKGVSVYNGTTFTNYDTTNAAFNGKSVYTLGKDINGKIWLSSVNGSFGYQGITTFDGSTWTNLTGYPSQVDGGEFSDFAFTSSNVAWIASGTGFTKYDGSFTFYPYATTGLWSSSSVAIDASSNIWAGGFDGLLKYNGSTWTFYNNVTNLGLTSNTLYYDIFPDGNLLWIATSSGLLKFDRNTGTVLANFKSGNSPLTDNCVTTITKASDGFLWLATGIGIVKMDPSVGIEEINNHVCFSVYPNPTNDYLTIETSQISEIEIFNLQGQLIKSLAVNENNLTIDVSAYARGMYFVKAKTEKEMVVKKFVKE